jgi:hypothetical protein
MSTSLGCSTFSTTKLWCNSNIGEIICMEITRHRPIIPIPIYATILQN